MKKNGLKNEREIRLDDESKQDIVELKRISLDEPERKQVNLAFERSELCE